MKMLNTNQVVFEGVTAKYPRLNQTYKFDTMENKTIPCNASPCISFPITRIGLEDSKAISNGFIKSLIEENSLSANRIKGLSNSHVILFLSVTK